MAKHWASELSASMVCKTGSFFDGNRRGVSLFRKKKHVNVNLSSEQVATFRFSNKKSVIISMVSTASPWALWN